MAPDYTKPPFSYFAPPGVVSISPAALNLARTFADEVRRVRPGEAWVISFDWADTRFIRHVDGPRQDLGAGLDLAAYDRSEVPPEVLQTVEGITVAIKIPTHIYQASARRLIDVEDDISTKLILR